MFQKPWTKYNWGNVAVYKQKKLTKASINHVGRKTVKI